MDKGWIDITEQSKADLPKVGATRIIRVGGALQRLESDGTGGALGSGGGADQGTLVTLGADTQDWSFATGLNGDTDGDYEVEFAILSDAVGHTIALQPNGSAPVSCERVAVVVNPSGGTVTAPAANTDMFLCDAGTADQHMYGLFRLSSKSGRVRQFNSTAHRPSNATVYQVNSTWADTATIITSLSIHGSAANSIKAGSIIRWRKLGFTA